MGGLRWMGGWVGGWVGGRVWEEAAAACMAKGRSSLTLTLLPRGSPPGVGRWVGGRVVDEVLF